MCFFSSGKTPAHTPNMHPSLFLEILQALRFFSWLTCLRTSERKYSPASSHQENPGSSKKGQKFLFCQNFSLKSSLSTGP